MNRSMPHGAGKEHTVKQATSPLPSWGSGGEKGLHHVGRLGSPKQREVRWRQERQEIATS